MVGPQGDRGCRSLAGSKVPVAGITQAGNDIAVRVQLDINRSGKDSHVRVFGLESFHSLRARHNADELDLRRAGGGRAAWKRDAGGVYVPADTYS